MSLEAITASKGTSGSESTQGIFSNLRNYYQEAQVKRQEELQNGNVWSYAAAYGNSQQPSAIAH